MKKILMLAAVITVIFMSIIETGCGVETKQTTQVDNGFKPIQVETIEVETIETETIEFEDVTTYWD